jgi:hypothetical protein
MRGIDPSDLFSVLRSHLKLSIDDSHESNRRDLVVSFIVEEAHSGDLGSWYEEVEEEIARITIQQGHGR